MNKKYNIVVLEISSWQGQCLDAEHYYGKLYFRDINGEFQVYELNRFITSEEELKYLRKKEGFKRYPTEPTNKFNKPSEIIELAKQTFKNHSPDADILLEGIYAVASPQQILAGPKKIMIEGNKIFNESEEIGGFEGDEDRMEQLCDMWDKLMYKRKRD